MPTPMPPPPPQALPLLLLALLAPAAAGTQVQIEDTPPEPAAHYVPQIYNLHIRTLQGELVEFLKYRGKVLLVANLASQCGYTESGYAQLNTLHRDYYGKGLRILGFPCNQFGKQEPGTSEDIANFAKSKGAEFEIFEKIDVNGAKTHEIFKLLKGDHTRGADACKDNHPECSDWAGMGECDANPGYMLTNCQLSCEQCAPIFKFGGDLRWNFEYFLVGKQGHVAARFRTGTDLTSADIRKTIESELDKHAAKDEL